MDIQEIETLVTSYIDQSLEGLDKENPKFDFKAIWYDLTSPKDISEFLKDTTSIVNTFGPDGYIVIGFDDGKKEFTQSTFRDSKLRDSSEVINLINGKVDRLFTVNTVDIVQHTLIDYSRFKDESGWAISSKIDTASNKDTLHKWRILAEREFE